ncbi:MAG: hypothetical protein M0R02_15710, partial [Bacteroidales bacterium]|nr:hypothetical protein [Bacteroidales bacterium]
LDTFCSAIGAVWYVDELGYLRAVQLNLPAEEADFEIGPDEIVKGGITLAGMEEPWTGLEVYYSRNFAPLESVSDEASASTNVRNMLVRDWYYSVITTSGANVAQHPNAQRPVMYTALNGSSAAIAMRNHHMSLRTVRRQRWRVDCLLAPALARVGDTVKVTYPALGFESGVNAFVVAVERNLTDAQVTLEVWF